MEAEIRTYSSEIDRLKELSKKVIEGASVAPAFVSVCMCVVGHPLCISPSHFPTTMQDRLGVKGQMEEDIVEEEVEV